VLEQPRLLQLLAPVRVRVRVQVRAMQQHLPPRRLPMK
jgi:hypothetical protein